MIKKEWLEVGKQFLYFVLLVAGIALVIGGIDLIQGRSFESEKFIIMLSLWLLMFSMFLGLSPFALDSKQKGMEYLLTLPYSRRRLLFIKLLPRLVAVALAYLAFVFLYSLIGKDALGGGFTMFSLVYFALFFISFSLSVIHENFVVQSIWAGIALSGYLALCLYIVVQGFSWKFKMPSSWLGVRPWQDLSYDIPTLLVSVAVFLLMAAPFIVSFFLVFKKFDLKPSRMFNRRHLLIFAPLLILAFAASLGVTYLVQNSSTDWDSDFLILKSQRLLKTGFPGKLTLYDETERHKVDTKSAVFWDRLLLEERDRLFLSGYDFKDGSRFIGFLNLADLSWKILHRCPNHYFVAPGYMAFDYDGEGFVYLRRSQPKRLGMVGSEAVKTEELELVRVDPANGKSETIMFHTPPFRKYNEPWFIGGDELNGLRFWLIARPLHNVLRIWEDGRVEDLGLSKGPPVFAGGLLFSCIDHSLQVRRLLDADAGSEIVKEIEGKFNLGNRYFVSPGNGQMGEIYAERNKRIVHIDMVTLAIDDVGPARGQIWMVQPGDFYYVEFESWPPLPINKWKKLYRLQGGKMIFLKQFDFADVEYGHIIVNSNGAIVSQWQVKSGNVKNESARIFAFPDLRELKFKKSN